MFDIGFWEIILVGIVALLVVGPDRFPGLIRDTARWAAKARRFVMDTKRDIEREIKFDDIEKDLSARARRPDLKPAPITDTKPEIINNNRPEIDKQTAA